MDSDRIIAAFFILTVGFVFFLLIGVIVAIIFLNGNIGSASGTHTGIITSVEYQNFITSDYLIYFKTSEESTQEEIYCINEDLVSKARVLSKDRTLVTIHFKNGLFMTRAECSRGISIVGAFS